MMNKIMNTQFEWIKRYCVPYTSYQMGIDRPLPRKMYYPITPEGYEKANQFALENNSTVIIETQTRLRP